jgi:hypothetical protein
MLLCWRIASVRKLIQSSSFTLMRAACCSRFTVGLASLGGWRQAVRKGVNASTRQRVHSGANLCRGLRVESGTDGDACGVAVAETSFGRIHSRVVLGAAEGWDGASLVATGLSSDDSDSSIAGHPRGQELPAARAGAGRAASTDLASRSPA